MRFINQFISRGHHLDMIPAAAGRNTITGWLRSTRRPASRDFFSTKTIWSIPWFMFRLKRWSQLTNHPVFLGLKSMCSCLITIFGASIAWFLLVKPPFVLLVSSFFGSSHYPMFCRGLVQAMLKLLQYGVHKDRGSEIGSMAPWRMTLLD